jgi:hypothetical protein
MKSIIDIVTSDMRMLFDPRNSPTNKYIKTKVSLFLVDKIESKIRHFVYDRLRKVMKIIFMYGK